MNTFATIKMVLQPSQDGKLLIKNIAFLWRLQNYRGARGLLNLKSQ